MKAAPSTHISCLLTQPRTAHVRRPMSHHIGQHTREKGRKKWMEITPTGGECVMEENRRKEFYSSQNNNTCLMVLSSDCNSNTSAVTHQRSTDCKSSNDLSADDGNQWSIDYIRNRDDVHGANRMHASILSMCGPPQSTLLSYDDLSRNIDANLAEIDMETFRSEDINSILALPTIYSASDEYQSEKNGEQTASVSASMLDNLITEENYAGEAQSSSSGAESAEVMSICKSEPLFSPVKEHVPLPAATVSVDSLDCESFDEQQELIMSCQANKENYTIAFEGSYTHISEDSDYHDADPSGSENDSTTWSHTLNNLPNTMSSSSSMVQSDYVFTTWRKLKNGKEISNNFNETRVPNAGCTPKTRSLPNLARKAALATSIDQSKISQMIDSSGSGQCVRLYDIQGNPMTQSKASDSSSQHSFSLVRLFVQNKTSPECEKNTNDRKFIDADNVHLHQRVIALSSNKGRYVHNNGNDGEEDDSESFEDSLVDDGRPQQSKKPATTPISEEENENTSDEAEYESQCNDFTFANQNSNRIYQYPKSSSSFKNISLGNQNINGYNQSQGTQTRKVKENSGGSSESLMRSSLYDSCGSISKKTVVFPKRSNRVVIAKTRSVGTQVPVPVCDQSVQTHCDPNAEFKTSVITDQPTIYEIPAHMYTSVCSNSGSSINSEKKSIYICYPNYSLPDLSFLATSAHSVDKFLLKPTRRVTPVRRSRSSDGREGTHVRPKSTSDVESFRKSGNSFNHIHDLDSLKFLLPEEYQEMIQQSHSNENSGFWGSADSKGSTQSLDCYQCQMKTSSDMDIPPMLPMRNRSQLVSESRRSRASIDDDLPPPLPPKRSISLSGNSVPKGILRKNNGCHVHSKRYSMTELRNNPEPKATKRCSLQEPLDIVWEKCLNMTPEMRSDLSQALEFVEELSEMPEYSQAHYDERLQTEMKSSHSCCNNSPTNPCVCQRRNEGLAGSGSTPDSVFTTSNRSFGRVSPDRRKVSPNTSYQQELQSRAKKSVSFSENIHIKAGQLPADNFVNDQRGYNINGYVDQLAGESGVSPTRSLSFMGLNADGLESPEESSSEDKVVIDLKKMQEMTKAVTTVADSLITYCSQLLNFKNELDVDVTKIIVSDFCPRLYSLLSYGLLPTIKSMFGNVQNSFWRVVEVSSPLTEPTKALHDLVLHVNSNESINTGLKKFTAFVLGLLNIHSLDSWLTYLRLKENILQEHYQSHSFMFLSTTISKSLYDSLLGTLQPLAVLPFKLDMQIVCKLSEPKQSNSFQSSYLNRAMNLSKSDESLSSLLSQARELRKAISQSSRTFQASRPLSQVVETKHQEAAFVTKPSQRPKSYGDFTHVEDSSVKMVKPERVVAKTAVTVEKQRPRQKEIVNASPTDEERIKRVHENMNIMEQNKNSHAKPERKAKPQKTDKNHSKYAVPKDSCVADKNKSDEVKFSELKKKWELMSHDEPNEQPKKKSNEKKKSSKLPSVNNPPSPTKSKSGLSSSKVNRKSFIPLPKSIGTSSSPQTRNSSLPMPAKKSTNMSRQISCPTRVTSPRKNI